jgi:hypothetical protein
VSLEILHRAAPCRNVLVNFTLDCTGNVMSWLLDRLFTHHDQPKPRFAFQGTVNWLRALAMASSPPDFEDAALRPFFAHVTRRTPNQSADTLAFECLLMAMAQVASARHLSAATGNVYDACRSAIVAWYYAIYYAGKAMLATRTGADPQTHTEAARIFQTEIVGPGLTKYPFDLSVTGLVPAAVQPAIDALRRGSTADLNTVPTSALEARGALCSYLKGTCEYRQWELEERVKKSGPFRALGVTDFRRAPARALRNAALAPESVNFLSQAFRYRGKANYRDAIYLSYGANNAASVGTLNADLAVSATAFVRMAAHYVSRRVEAGTWADYAADVMAQARFTPPFDLGAI